MENEDEIRAKVEKSLKRFRRPFDNLEKRFDLGFISEEEFQKRRIKLIRKFALDTLAESEEHLKHIKKVIRKGKLDVTRLTQRYIKVLVEPDGLKHIGEFEEILRHREKLLKEYISHRKHCEENIKQVKDMLKKLR